MYPFHPCFTICVTGCTGSGKTSLVFKLLSQSSIMFLNEPPSKILYCYNVYQSMFQNMEKTIENIEFFRGLPGEEKINELSKNKKHNIIVLDDLMQEICNDVEMEKLFTQKSHHLHFTVIFITQNIFCKGVSSRTISLNLHYYILMRNPRGMTQVRMLGHQIGQTKILMEAYKDATREKYSYLLIDLSPTSDDAHRFRTKIFNQEDTILYIESKNKK